MAPSKKPTPPSRPLDEQTLRQQILQHLQTLNIPLANEQLDALLKEADQSRFSHLQFLARFLAIPSNQRLERGIERRIRIAKFRDNVSLETFDWSFNASTIDRLQLQELATGDFVRRRDNVVFVGPSGLGKSHLIQGLGRQCCVLGYRVRYTTNVDFKEWTEYLGDPPLAMALLDRVVDGAIIHKFHGRSYRAHRAERKGQPGGKPSRSAAKRADAPSVSES